MTNPTGMEATDWSRYPDGMGETSAVPALLDELAAGPKKSRAQAIAVELGEERLVHQDSVAPAAVPAVPRLVALLSAPEPAQKEDILLVLARIAAGGGPEPHWHGRPEGPDSLHALDERVSAAAQAKELDPTGASRAAVIAGRDAIASLLEDKRAIVRAASALVLALLPPDDATSRAVAARLKKEKDEKARGALLLCLSSWQRAFGLSIDPALVASPEPKPFAELCRAVARAWSPELRDDAARDVLVAAVKDPPKGFDATKDLPVSSRDLAFEALRAAYPAAAREVGLSGLREGHFPVWQVLMLGLPVRPPGAVWADVPLPEELPPDQLTFLRAVVEALPDSRSSSWLPWGLARATGLPQHRGDIRRWLGLDPPGPMETVMAGEISGERVAWPAYRWYRRIATDRIPKESLAGALRAHPSPDEALAVALTSCEGHVYDLFYVGAWSWIDSVLLAREVLGARPDAEAALRRRLSDVKFGWAPLVVLSSLTRVLLPRGEVLPESADPLVVQACEEHPPLVHVVREVVQALPAPRRDAIVMALPLPASLPVQATVWNVKTGGRPKGWAFLDLASDRTAAARKATTAIAAWDPPPSPSQRLPDEEAISALSALGSAALPAIDEALPGATPAGRDVLGRARSKIAAGAA